MILLRPAFGLTCLLLLLLNASFLWAENEPQKTAYKVIVYSFDSDYNELLAKELATHWGKKVEMRAAPLQKAEAKPVTGGTVFDPQKVIDDIASLADDPKIKALIFFEALPGALEGSIRLRAKRPDIIVMAISPHEDSVTFSQVASLIIYINDLARGYIIPQMALKMRADTLVELTFERHMQLDILARRSRIMQTVAHDMGLYFVQDLKVPDIGRQANQDAVREYLAKAIPEYIAHYGTKTCFVTTSSVVASILPGLLLEYGGLTVEAAQPGDFTGYPAAFGLMEESEKLFGQWSELLRLLDERVIERKLSGRFVIWPYPYHYIVAMAMVDIAVGILDEQLDIYDLNNVSVALEKFSDGAKWLVSPMYDYEQGGAVPHTVMVLQDSYVLGVGYQGLTNLNIPVRYYRIK